jgi:predicted DNA-binding protein YlxM (UPF0122 family)
VKKERTEKMITDAKLCEFYFKKYGNLLSKEKLEIIREDLNKQRLAELLDIVDSDGYDVIKKGEEHFKRLKIKDEVFEVNIVPSQNITGYYLFSFKLIKSPYKEKPIMQSNDMQKYLKDLEKYEFGITNSGNPLEILKTMKSVLYRFIKNYNPDGVIIKDFDEGGRNKVYEDMSKDVSKKLGYKYLHSNHHYVLIKNDESLLKFINSN